MDNIKEVQDKLFAAADRIIEAANLLRPEHRLETKFGDIVTAEFSCVIRRVVLYDKRGKLQAFDKHGGTNSPPNKYYRTGESIFGPDNPLKLDI
ncbi:MAG: hypothetical protein MUP81_04290 [Dehalococcoidia bacterium]|nr:hypothetical protein [Dehalococcoidia bacterium]